MTDSKLGTSIKIFLVDGTPDGLRFVERSNWTGRALVVSRSEYPEVRSRPEFGNPGHSRAGSRGDAGLSRTWWIHSER